MILVDDRAGSYDLIKPLRAAGLPVEETRLDSGDLAFLGRGERDTELFIGIEHKKVGDLINSLTTGRLSGHQLLAMTACYDRRWLVVEGEWRHDADGAVTMFGRRGRRRVHGAPPAVELEKRLLTLQVRGGISVRHCPTRRDTVRFVLALYRFWTDKSLNEHRSHLALYDATPDMDPRLAIPISDFRRIAAMIPGVGYRTSQAVEAAFEGSFRRMMLATEEDWAAIATTDDRGKTKRLGAAKAKKILEALR